MNCGLALFYREPLKIRARVARLQERVAPAFSLEDETRDNIQGALDHIASRLNDQSLLLGLAPPPEGVEEAVTRIAMSTSNYPGCLQFQGAGWGLCGDDIDEAFADLWGRLVECPGPDL